VSAGLAARRAALKILDGVRRGTPFDAALDRSVGQLDDADRRLAHELAAGVLRRQSALDAALARHVPRGLAKVPPPLHDLLRLGAYQLTALDRVPVHAAVDTSVRLAREVGGARATGFVNAVLRAVARDTAGGRATGDAGPGDAAGQDAAALAERESHPEWLVRRWLARYGPEGTKRLLRWNNTRPRLVLQPARASTDELAERLRGAGVTAEPAPFGAGLAVDRSRPADLPGYDTGDFVVQDSAQSLVTWFADVPPGALVYDACAAPGGKTIGLGRTAGRVVAADVSRRRAQRLAVNLARAGSGHEWPVVADAAAPPVRSADVVLLDAPCLGTGTFARHPDARWRATESALHDLARDQAALLEAAAGTVAPGGLLVYATCSLEPEENERQTEAFLARHPEFRREPADLFPEALLSPDGDLMALPHRHATDGAYAARLRREG
jgi:16S rRNA (cytosine967-C5)-methyltransferase